MQEHFLLTYLMSSQEAHNLTNLCLVNCRAKCHRHRKLTTSQPLLLVDVERSTDLC